MGLSKIIAYFANSNDPKDPYLCALKEELEAIREIIEEVRRNTNINIEFLPRQDPQISRIGKDIRDYLNEIRIFHFSGHSEVMELKLKDGSPDFDGLTSLLKESKNLKMVFLNSCSSFNLIESLFKKNIKVVLATKSKIQDRVAKKFAVEFYKFLFKPESTIRSAFEHAINVLKTERFIPNNIRNEPKIILRGLVIERDEDDKDKWELYINGDEGEKIIDDPNWYYVFKEKSSVIIDKDLKYTCGREEYIPHFDNFNKRNKEKAKHFFTITSEEDSPEGLTHKIVYERFTRDIDDKSYLYLANPNSKQKYIELNSPLFLSNENIIAYEVYKKVITPQENLLNDGDFEEYINAIVQSVEKQRGDSCYCFFHIKMNETLFEEKRFEKLKVFIDKFNKILRNKENSIKFYFFWNISLRPFSKKISNIFGIFRKKTLAKHFIKEFNECDDIYFFSMKNLEFTKSWVININYEYIAPPNILDYRKWIISLKTSSNNPIKVEELSEKHIGKNINKIIHNGVIELQSKLENIIFELNK
ncbi:hypothetical protein [Emticicia sp. BO119]|uniref:hypothetical protein n=1 Tax=Emticicia sp. BO119 TaxID=2757768 RepID=UPI0015F063C6|nr:hypothetical protein [Emticicia sp. BO119]MBA4852389.1 hypothetical protein [Emticicia sp. BO119]